MGAIGVNALEPKGFRDSLDKGVMPKYNPDDEEKKINFNTYQIWLLSMLNNEQLWEKSIDFAQQLIDYKSKEEKSSTKKQTKVEALLQSTTKTKFLDALTAIAKDGVAEVTLIAQEVHFMSVNDYTYFSTLLRFQYASLNNIKK